MGKSFALILFFLCAALGNAQDSLCVFKSSSSVLVELEGIKRPLKKGDFLTGKGKVHLMSPSEVTFINSEGDAFGVTNVGIYTYKAILNHRAIEEQKSLTSKYFKLIWDELLKRKSGETIIGGVFRGDVLMEFPIDNTKTASSKLSFIWKPDPDAIQYYVFIRPKDSDEVYKFATNGNTFQVYKDNPIFANVKEFEWSVSTSEFPNLKNIPFYSFTILDRNEYEVLKSGYKDLITDLKTLGLSTSEIEEVLCETYGVCK